MLKDANCIKLLQVINLVEELALHLAVKYLYLPRKTIIISSYDPLAWVCKDDIHWVPTLRPQSLLNGQCL